MENKCSEETCNYESHDMNHCHLKHEGQNKIDKNAEMWFCAFHEAMREAQVEILKAKILSAWKTKLDKSADAVLETMEIKWQSVLNKEKAKADLLERLAKIMMEAKK